MEHSRVSGKITPQVLRSWTGTIEAKRGSEPREGSVIGPRGIMGRVCGADLDFQLDNEKKDRWEARVIGNLKIILDISYL